MKREGRQHGMVRTHRILPSPFNPRPPTRVVNEIDSPPTSGVFTKVSSKPTNHSKFTGKCGRSQCVTCHLHPACKSKDKTKGTQKLNSNDLVSNRKLITWRVVDGRKGLNFSGFSASGMLDHLANDYMDDEIYDDEEEDNDTSYGMYGERDEITTRNHGGDDDDHEEKYQDVMSFYDVGVMLDPIEGEEEGGWCLVGENAIA